MTTWKAQQAVHGLFSRCDCSGSGYVTRERLQRECSLDEAQIDDVFTELDQDNDGRITFDEFAAGYERLMETCEDDGAWSALDYTPDVLPEVKPEVSAATAVDAEQTARELFERCDTTGSGCVDRLEFSKGLTSLGYSLSESDFNILFDSLDQDGDGVISLADFVKGYSRHYQDDDYMSPNTDHESGTFEYENWDDMMSFPDADLLSGSGFEKVQDIWDEVRLNHPELLEPLEEVMATMSHHLKEQRAENTALVEKLNLQNVLHAEDVKALDMEAREQLAEVEELAKSQATFVERRIKHELSQKLTDKEEELRTAYDKVKQLEQQVSLKSLNESEMREKLKQLHEDRMRLQSLLSKTAHRKLSISSPLTHNVVAKNKSPLANRRSVSMGTLLNDKEETVVPVRKESHHDLLEELEMLRDVNAELKRQVRDQDDEKAMQIKEHRTVNRVLVKRSSNLGKYVKTLGPAREECEFPMTCDVLPANASPKSKYLLQLLLRAPSASSSQSVGVTPSPTFHQLAPCHVYSSQTIDDVFYSSDNMDAPQRTEETSDTRNSLANCGIDGEASDLDSTLRDRVNESNLSSSVSDQVGGSSSPESGCRHRHRSGSWPLRALVTNERHSFASDDLECETKRRRAGVFVRMVPMVKPDVVGRKRRALEDVLRYDSSCDLTVCLSTDRDSRRGYTDGSDAGRYQKDRCSDQEELDELDPKSEHVEAPDTLQTLHAVASRLKSSEASKSISFNVSPRRIGKTPDRMYKVVFVGNSDVGKTSLVNRLCTGEFCTFAATIGVDFRVKLVTIDCQLISLQLWDTAGQEKYRRFGLTSQYYRKADGVILVYDATNRQSYMDVREWISCIESATGNDSSLSVMLLANKMDLVFQQNKSSQQNGKYVHALSGESLAKQLDASYFEVSAKTGFNVEESCSQFVRKLYERENMLINSTLSQFREGEKRERPKSVIVLGENLEYQPKGKKCSC